MYFETERLGLRNFMMDDLDELVDYRNDSRSNQYQRGQSKERDRLEQLIIRRQNDDLYSEGEKLLAIEALSNNQLIGDIYISIKEPTITLGYTISYKLHRQGLAFELLSHLIEDLHDKYPAYEVVGCIDQRNTPSINLLTKLGFENEGYEEKIDALIFSKYNKKSR